MMLCTFSNGKEEIKIVAATRQEAKIALTALLRECRYRGDEFILKTTTEIRASLVVSDPLSRRAWCDSSTRL